MNSLSAITLTYKSSLATTTFSKSTPIYFECYGVANPSTSTTAISVDYYPDSS